MAVIHPDDRIAQIQRRRSELHPAVGLVAGFGIITAGAVLVHVLFNMMF